MRIDDENEKQWAEISVSSESEVKVSESGHQSTDIFKKPQFIIVPRRGKVVVKVRTIDARPQEQPVNNGRYSKYFRPRFRHK
jgi:hypothetical protein